MNWIDLGITLPITNPTWTFFIVLMIILFAPMIFDRLRIPHIIGMILAGICIGEYGFNILERDSSFELFGKVGLYYIMFLAALEMDVSNFSRYGKQGLAFGLLTFAVPFGVTLAVGIYVLHFSLLASMLLACILSSHTLIAYPIVGRFGLEKHVSVVISIVATAIAIFLALLIVAGIVASQAPNTDVWFWIWFVVKLVAYVGFVVYAFPRIARAFFRRYDDNVMQYIFVMGLVFFSAAMAELAGLDGLIGAFLAGLVINRLIPSVSPLMSRIEFVGNALFIPYFLIGVGMIINVGILLQGSGVLLIILILVMTATLTKWIPAWLIQKCSHLQKTDRLMMFGLTNAHAAGALAIVMIGTKISDGQGGFVMDDTILNATVMLILVSCIVSSLATERASRKLAMDETSLEDNQGKQHGRCLIAYSNPETVEVLTQFAMLIRNKTQNDSLLGLTVSFDDEKTELKRQQKGVLLERAEKIASSADVEMFTLNRVGNNVASSIVHTVKEYEAGEIVLGLHRKANLADTFFGMIVANVLKGIHREVIVVHSLIPANTWRKIVVAVPEKAEYEVGFYKWLEHVCRIGEQLGCRVQFFSHPDTKPYLQQYIKKLHAGLRSEYEELDNWEELLMLTKVVEYDHLLIVVSARSGFISYQPSFEKLPTQLGRYFANNSTIVLFPDQLGDPQNTVSFSAPHV